MRDILGYGQIRNSPVVSAGGAEHFGAVRQHHPIADFMLGVGAEAKAVCRIGERLPTVAAVGLERTHLSKFGKVADAPTAAVALVALEIERLLAMLTFEQFHAPSLR